MLPALAGFSWRRPVKGRKGSRSWGSGEKLEHGGRKVGGQGLGLTGSHVTPHTRSSLQVPEPLPGSFVPSFVLGVGAGGKDGLRARPPLPGPWRPPVPPGSAWSRRSLSPPAPEKPGHFSSFHRPCVNRGSDNNRTRRHYVTLYFSSVQNLQKVNVAS